MVAKAALRLTLVVSEKITKKKTMNIALHTPDKTHFPNYALMKLSAWHKAKGNNVEWFTPIRRDIYDEVYSSSVFTQKSVDPYTPRDKTFIGGTGYGVMNELDKDIDDIFPDYSIYTDIDYAIGFLTRGCIRSCPWCIVPEKEGKIKPYRNVEQIARLGYKKIVLMDNNVLASQHGLNEIEKLGRMDYKIDFNQGLDARLVTPQVARLLVKCKWIRFIRFSCDTKAMMPEIEKAVTLLRDAGCTQELFCYMLVKDIQDAYYRAEFLRNLKVDPFAQPYRDYSGTEPTMEQKRFARWVNQKAIFKTIRWEEYKGQRS